MSTPYDDPHTLWERLTFPMLKVAYEQGVEESRERTRFDVSISKVTSTPGQAEDVRRMALERAKLGVQSDDLEPMVRLYWTEPQRTLNAIDNLRRGIEQRYATVNERPQESGGRDRTANVGADGGGHQIEPKQPVSEDNGNWDSRGNA